MFALAPRIAEMSSPFSLSTFLSDMKASQAHEDDDNENEPDWLMESDDEVRSCCTAGCSCPVLHMLSSTSMQGSAGSPVSDSKDPFLFLTTPIKLSRKDNEDNVTARASSAGDDGQHTPERRPAIHGSESTLEQTPASKKKGGQKRLAKSAGMLGTEPMKIKNPDKIIFNRVCICGTSLFARQEAKV